jgi:hypothetical protein
MKDVDQADKFEVWLADMDDALERFLNTVPSSVGESLDFSPGSLAPLEQWIPDRYPTVESILRPAESQVVDALARYVGETFRRSLNGRWEIRFDDPKYAFYGLPQVTTSSRSPTPIAPITLVSAAAERRSGQFLENVLAGIIARR